MNGHEAIVRLLADHKANIIADMKELLRLFMRSE
jgi:hypothetical protein